MPEKKVETEGVSELTKKLEKALAEQYRTQQGVIRDGKKLIIPEYMTYEDAAKAILQYQSEQEEEVQSILEVFEHPYNALYAFHQGMSATFGKIISASSTFSFFGMTQTIPGRSITIPISEDEKDSLTVPLGEAQIPGLPIKLKIVAANPHDYDPARGPGSAIYFTYKRKYTPLVKDIEAKTLEFAKHNSIFKGKAIDDSYKFINLNQFDPSKVVYSAHTQRQLDANVFSLITHTEEARLAGIGLKKGILLSGGYGTGKTLTALKSALLCRQNGWTFIQCKNGANIGNSITLAQKLQPAMVFCEDIDSATGTDERTTEVNEILNTIDGMLSKDSEVMVILTTNHIERINRAMLRPGRLDAIIEMKPFDPEAIVKFIFANAKDKAGESLIDGELDGQALHVAASEYPPAFITEAINKAKAYAITRSLEHGYASALIGNDDIHEALVELRPQFEMMQSSFQKEPPKIEAAFSRLIKEALEEEFQNTRDSIPDCERCN